MFQNLVLRIKSRKQITSSVLKLRRVCVCAGACVFTYVRVWMTGCREGQFAGWITFVSIHPSVRPPVTPSIDLSVHPVIEPNKTLMQFATGWKFAGSSPGGIFEIFIDLILPTAV
jgi:hypothetical protein